MPSAKTVVWCKCRYIHGISCLRWRADLRIPLTSETQESCARASILANSPITRIHLVLLVMDPLHRRLVTAPPRLGTVMEAELVEVVTVL
jgi:hypothetical protein